MHRRGTRFSKTLFSGHHTLLSGVWGCVPYHAFPEVEVLCAQEKKRAIQPLTIPDVGHNTSARALRILNIWIPFWIRQLFLLQTRKTLFKFHSILRFKRLYFISTFLFVQNLTIKRINCCSSKYTLPSKQSLSLPYIRCSLIQFNFMPVGILI